MLGAFVIAREVSIGGERGAVSRPSCLGHVLTYVSVSRMIMFSMSDLDHVYLVTFPEGAKGTLPIPFTLRQFVDRMTDPQLADLVDAIAARLAVRGRKAEAQALFTIERFLYTPPTPMGGSR